MIEKLELVRPEKVFDTTIQEIASIVSEPSSKAYMMAFVPFDSLPDKLKKEFKDNVKKWKIGLNTLIEDFIRNYRKVSAVIGEKV